MLWPLPVLPALGSAWAPWPTGPTQLGMSCAALFGGNSKRNRVAEEVRDPPCKPAFRMIYRVQLPFGTARETPMASPLPVTTGLLRGPCAPGLRFRGLWAVRSAPKAVSGVAEALPSVLVIWPQLILTYCKACEFSKDTLPQLWGLKMEK